MYRHSVVSAAPACGVHVPIRIVKHGASVLFITVTRDSIREWPEIKAALWPNDKACHRPDLIPRMFEWAGCFGDAWNIFAVFVCFSSAEIM
ncbi:BQ5605_C002g01268 [Microbotryum silenes-dioicae]|uniref:BQ5605_C002g01268 protein n=1 Tax=Microbotryum silenes-dioicae TaxID=796604 RepID=A0A2X0P1C2_9BASI|nr:BQ5605_C002g01268 [Microbotryum silenes-dioicae]